jgi:hypothetical protein
MVDSQNRSSTPEAYLSHDDSWVDIE